MEVRAKPLAPLKHRRSSSRLRTGLPAQLIDLWGNREVRLEDVSRSGARILAPAHVQLHLGELVVLRWAGLEKFGEIVWAGDGKAGIRFDEEVDEDGLLATRRLQDQAMQLGSHNRAERNAAREWVEGRRNF